MWATRPSDDPAQLAAEFSRAFQNNPFIEEHAEIWLIYSDSTCWEIFARNGALLDTVRDSLRGHATIRVYENDSKDRDRAWTKAGIGYPYQRSLL